jgi:hypothetical protein
MTFTDKGNVMPKLEEYRAWADKSLERARAAQTESERVFYLDLARTHLCEVVRPDSVTFPELPPAATLFPLRGHWR